MSRTARPVAQAARIVPMADGSVMVEMVAADREWVIGLFTGDDALERATACAAATGLEVQSTGR